MRPLSDSDIVGKNRVRPRHERRRQDGTGIIRLKSSKFRFSNSIRSWRPQANPIIPRLQIEGIAPVLEKSRMIGNPREYRAAPQVINIQSAIHLI
jgi:hypothetical protein